MAELKLDAAFDFFSKIQTPFFCFHDRDIAPEGSTYSETKKNLDHIVNLMEKKDELLKSRDSVSEILETFES